MGKLLIIRHGHTSLNQPGRDERLRGWLDVPLDREGLEEAAKTAEEVRAQWVIDAIYSSDLRRTRQTAEALRSRVKAPLYATRDLRPWNLGVFCGQRVRDILPFLNLMNQHLDVAAPGGESFYQFYGRYSHRLRALLKLVEETRNCIAVVTHVRNLLATSSIIVNSDIAKIPVKGGPQTGTVVTVEQIQGHWRIGASRHEFQAAQDVIVGAEMRATSCLPSQ